jgi:hypothetical protein
VQKIKLQPNAPDEEKSKKKERRPMALQKQQDPRNGVTHGSRTHGGAETESCQILIGSFLLIGLILLGLYD